MANHEHDIKALTIEGLEETLADLLAENERLRRELDEAREMLGECGDILHSLIVSGERWARTPELAKKLDETRMILAIRAEGEYAKNYREQTD